MTASPFMEKVYRFGRLWSKYSLWPLIGLAIILVILMSIPALVDGPAIDLDGEDAFAQIARDAVPLVWAVFVIDVLVRLVTSRHRKIFVREHWLELVAIVIPYIPHLHVLKLLSVFLILGSRVRGRVSRRIVIYVISLSVISWYVLGLGITEAEGDKPNQINSLQDGLWWSFELLATGSGFAENFPTTDAGRVLGATGFLLSYAFIGGMTAALVAWLVSVGQREEDEELAPEIQQEIVDMGLLRDEIVSLRAEVQELRTDLARLPVDTGSTQASKPKPKGQPKPPPR